MKGCNLLKILCPVKDEVVRVLQVKGDNVDIDAITTVVTVPLSTEINYRPWVMDRGDLTFKLPNGNIGVLCAELDILQFDDHTTSYCTWK